MSAAGPPVGGRPGGAANPWLGRRVLLTAHRGGALEAPENTMAALRRAVDLGAEMLELDVRATRDGELVVLHDATVERTTDGEGAVADLPLDAVRALDAAHWFVPGVGAETGRAADAYPLRGIATGAYDGADAPGWVVADDLRVPTLAEVLAAFPTTLLTIEVKATAPQVPPYEEELARLLAEAGRSDDVLVASFQERAVKAIGEHAPQVTTAAPPSVITRFWEAADEGGAPPRSEHAALQVPVAWMGMEVVTANFVELAHAHHHAVHAWTVDDAPTMRWLVDLGVDAIMSDRPSLLREVLDDLGVRPARR